ncbi:MAG: hypothetical protein IPM57_08200 [Oligoflexia bacterium]|nr:hypothetical protein [Oligoflexia bacterium]
MGKLRILNFLALSLSLNLAYAELVIKVENLNGEPEAGAQVLVGHKPNDPFENNWTRTNSQGIVSFKNIENIENLPITIVSPLRPNVTYLKQSGNYFELLVPSPKPQDISDLKGQFKGWLSPGQNNHVDFGVVLPLINASRIFELQVSDFMSTKMDQITVAGKTIFLPSNISLPKQKLKYSIFTITLEKPSYMLPVPSPQKYHFSAFTGRFPFEKVANTLMSNDKTFLDVINDVKFENEFTIYDQEITQSSHQYDFNIKDAHKLSPCINTTAKNIPEDYKILTAALVQDTSQVGLPYSVTDLKLTSSNPQQLNCISNDVKNISIAAIGLNYKTENKKVTFGKGFTISIKRNIPRFEAFSIANPTVEFSEFFNIPKVTVLNGGSSVMFTRVERENLSPLASGFYAVLSEVLQRREPAVDGDLIEYNIPKWMVFSNAPIDGFSVANFDLPQLPKDFFQQSFTPKRFKRWEVTWLGKHESRATEQQFDFNYFKEATHAARNSSDF